MRDQIPMREVTLTFFEGDSQLLVANEKSSFTMKLSLDSYKDEQEKMARFFNDNGVRVTINPARPDNHV